MGEFWVLDMLLMSLYDLQMYMYVCRAMQKKERLATRTKKKPLITIRYYHVDKLDPFINHQNLSFSS